jgi:surface-anchored protein
MNTVTIPVAMLLAAAAAAQSQFDTLTREHVDCPAILYQPASTPPLELIAWQRELNTDLRSNEVLFVVRDAARVALPAGTPFGNAGAPMWILPQTQNPSLLFLGVNAERVPAGAFNGLLTIRLVGFDGPGYFMAWQATGPGQFNIRIDTRDGLGAADALTPLIGSHEHFNWGFSTTGVYCLTWQVSGQRASDGATVASAETTFTFHVQPVPPPTNFATWRKVFWPPGFNPPTTLTNGNSDGDVFPNLLEYAFGLSPTNSNPIAAAPEFDFVTNAGTRHAALAFFRYLPARDLEYVVEATSALPGGWTPLTNVYSSAPGPTNTVERVTIRDFLPATAPQRFLRLRVNPR